MSPAQQSALRRLARTCAETRSYAPLVHWVDAYKVSASAPELAPKIQSFGDIVESRCIDKSLADRVRGWWRNWRAA